jgi:hypothetical protein
MRGRRIKYSADELAWIKARAHMARIDLHALFVKVWSRPEITFDNIKSLCVRKKWSAGPDYRRRQAGKSNVLSTAEIEWLKVNYQLSASEVGPALRGAFPGGSNPTDRQIASWRNRNRMRTGNDAKFKPGMTPWCKGKKLGPNQKSAATQFKPGQKAHNAKPIGYESINSDGYVLICVDRPSRFYPDRPTHMAFKHRELWVAVNGPVPEGHALKCLDGDKTNCNPKNWEAVPLGLLARLHGKSGRDYDRAPAELKPTIMAIAKLEHAARGARKGQSHG